MGFSVRRQMQYQRDLSLKHSKKKKKACWVKEEEGEKTVRREAVVYLLSMTPWVSLSEATAAGALWSYLVAFESQGQP